MKNILKSVIVLSLFIVGCGNQEQVSDKPNPNQQGKESMSQAEQDRRIDYIEFTATDIEVTKKFYTEVFGWEFMDYGPEYTSFRDGRLNGGFALASEVSVGGPLVVIYAKNLVEVEASIKQNGGSIVLDIFEFPGGRRFHFSDPSGNILAVWSEK